MLRAANSVLRANANQLQQCMKISSTKTNYLAAAAPQPQTNPDILYTGVRIILYFHLFFVLVLIIHFNRRTTFMKNSRKNHNNYVVCWNFSYSSTTNGTRANLAKCFQQLIRPRAERLLKFKQPAKKMSILLLQPLAKPSSMHQIQCIVKRIFKYVSQSLQTWFAMAPNGCI